MNDRDRLLSFLLTRFEDFSEWWQSEDNYNFSENGSFTLAGLCAEFSQFYIDNFEAISTERSTELFDEIESLLTHPDNVQDFEETSNSIRSCFLENIARTKAGEESRKRMGELTRKFFDEWHVYP